MKRSIVYCKRRIMLVEITQLDKGWFLAKTRSNKWILFNKIGNCIKKIVPCRNKGDAVTYYQLSTRF